MPDSVESKPSRREPRSDRTVAEVAAAILFAQNADEIGRVVFLIGAGCSITAGVPGAAIIARRMVQEVGKKFKCGAEDASDVAFYTGLVAKGRLSPCLIGDPTATPTDATIDWYRVYDDMFVKNYTTPDQVRRLFESLVEQTSGAINWAHLCLGELVRRKLVSTVLTTNFDQLVLLGLTRAGVLPVVCDGMESLNRIVGAPRHPQLVELHGSRYTYRLLNRPDEVEAIRDDPQAAAAIQALFQHAMTFVAVGYGGREHGVMDLLVRAAKAYPDKYVYWVSHSQTADAIGEKVRDFLGTTKNGGVLPGQDADRFFLDLCRELGVGAPSAVASPLESITQILDALDRSESVDKDIEKEIKAAREVLRQLGEQDRKIRSSSAAEPARMREARLAGNAAEAYRQATDITIPIPSEESDRLLVEETALAALDYGAQVREQKPLEQAAEWFRLLIDNSKGEVGAVTRWAAGLGEALGLLGEKDHDLDVLEGAIQARSTAAASVDRRESPVEWAQAQVSLGNALQVAGRVSGNHSHLERAVGAYEAALEEITRDRYPLDWAAIQNNTARILTKLGKKKNSKEHLRTAVDLLLKSLTERTRERVPLEWAVTQANLGEALRSLGEREGNASRLDEAVDSYRQALEVLTPESAPDRYRSTASALQSTLDEIAHRTAGGT